MSRSWFASFASFAHDNGDVELPASMSLWLGSTKAGLDAVERYGDRVIVLLFEDLVLRTEAAIDPDTTVRHHTELAGEQRAEIDRIATPVYDDVVRRFGLEQPV